MDGEECLRKRMYRGRDGGCRWVRAVGAGLAFDTRRERVADARFCSGVVSTHSREDDQGIEWLEQGELQQGRRI